VDMLDESIRKTTIEHENIALQMIDVNYYVSCRVNDRFINSTKFSIFCCKNLGTTGTSFGMISGSARLKL
jgi:hypothetical protein